MADPKDIAEARRSARQIRETLEARRELLKTRLVLLRERQELLAAARRSIGQGAAPPPAPRSPRGGDGPDR
jgi:hypothetical protein